MSGTGAVTQGATAEGKKPLDLLTTLTLSPPVNNHFAGLTHKMLVVAPIIVLGGAVREIPGLREDSRFVGG